MERHEILQMMATLQLSGMRAAYDEIVQTGVKRQHSFERILGALLKGDRREACTLDQLPDAHREAAVGQRD